MTESHLCTGCGEAHIVQQAHKEQMDKTLLLMLKASARWVIDNNKNDFKKRDLGLSEMSQSAYGNFGRLRYHGLITPVRGEDGKRIKGRWLITRNGWAFLRGTLNIPKFVLVKNNTITSRSDKLTSVRDVYYGSEVIQTNFEYYDDDGNQVGFRPAFQQPVRQHQESLL